MTIKAEVQSEGNPTAPNYVGISSNSLPVAIPFGNALEPEPVIVVYNDDNDFRGETGRHTTAADAILITHPTTGTGISTSFAPSPRISPFATTSFVLGTISIVFFLIFGILLGLLAIIFGVLAVKRINNQPDQYRGLCLAYSGIITGTIAVICWITFFATFAASDVLIQ